MNEREKEGETAIRARTRKPVEYSNDAVVSTYLIIAYRGPGLTTDHDLVCCLIERLGHAKDPLVFISNESWRPVALQRRSLASSEMYKISRMGADRIK